MRICLNDVTFRTRWMRTRFPFRYGIAAMTELPHVFLSAKVMIDGEEIVGLASEGLPPKWFTKNRETTFEQDLPEMLQVIEKAVEFGRVVEEASVFAWWQNVYSKQDAWADGNDVPPLLAADGLAGRNDMELFVFSDVNGKRFWITARLDNLGKGASGAAVQNMNIALGLKDHFGLN